MTLNPKFTFFLVIGVMVIALFGFVNFQKIQAENKEIAYQEKLKQDKLLEDSFIQVVLEPTAIPTPYQLYAPKPIRIDNSLDIGQYFKWSSLNASGLKGIGVNTTMYGYKELNRFTYYDYQWGQDFFEVAPDGMEYFFAYIYTEMIDDGATIYLPQQYNYGLLINDEMYYPTLFNYEQNQIREMDEQFNKNHVERIKPYAYEYLYAQNNLTHVKSPIMSPREYLRAGKSNAEDGYIIFTIPKEHNKRMLRLYGDFFSFGSASWKIV